MENKILGPAIRKGLEQGLEQGLQQGREQGREQGQRELLGDLFLAKFGSLPEWATRRLQSASSEELKSWAGRILSSTTLEDTLRLT